MTGQGFWAASSQQWGADTYEASPPTPATVAQVEAALGYRLPASFVELMRLRNGGVPAREAHPARGTSWAQDHVAVTGLFGIGAPLIEASTGAIGEGYPPLGVYFADCPSAGHDLIALDYRECGPAGEPAVVHVDQEFGYRVTWLAPDFATFSEQLRPLSDYDEPGQVRLERELTRVQSAPFSALLQGLLDFYPDESLPTRLRNLAAAIVQGNGSFTLQDDQLSWLLYDVQFLLASTRLEVSSPAGYLHVYSTILANVGEEFFGTDGYALAYVEDWLRARIGAGWLEATSVGIRFTAEAELTVLTGLEAYR